MVESKKIPKSGIFWEPEKGVSAYHDARKQNNEKAASGVIEKTEDPVIEALYDNWDEIQGALEEQRYEIIDHFNGLIEGEDDLGEILFGDKEDFKARVGFLDDKNLETFRDALFNSGVIDSDSLQFE